MLLAVPPVAWRLQNLGHAKGFQRGMLRPLLLVAVLLLASCGAPAAQDPTADDVRAALGGAACLLDEDITFGWVRAGVDGLRAGREAIASGSRAVRAVDPTEVRRRLGEADVVLVADLHHRDLHRRMLTRLLRAHAATTDLGAGRIGLGIESVAPEDQERLADLVARRDRAGLRGLLRASWPWPVEAMVEVWLDRTLAGVVPFALGDQRDGRHGDTDLADGARSPELLPRRAAAPTVLPLPQADEGPALPFSLELEEEWLDVKYGLTFGRKNERVAAACAGWVRSAPGRRMFVLYGAAHLLEDAETGHGIRDLLVRAGLRVEVVVPGLIGWERALLQRFGPAALRTTYEVLPGVLRVPVAPQDLLGV